MIHDHGTSARKQKHVETKPILAIKANLGEKFRIEPDHKPLTWLNEIEPDLILIRCRLKLQQFDFDGSL